jgi:hypothetical protein
MPSQKEIALSHAHLLLVLDYNPGTGVFKWRNIGNNHKKIIAGRIHYSGYRDIRIGRYLYRASRLAWFYMTGKWPINEIDHKDLNSLNDAFDNLREATRSQNNANKPNRSSVAKGVRRYGNKYQAVLCHKYLGTFSTVAEASAAYQKAAAIKFGTAFVRVQEKYMLYFLLAHLVSATIVVLSVWGYSKCCRQLPSR